MRENWNNNRQELNGRVKPTIVLHSEQERIIAQNAHNLVWEKYRQIFDEIENKLKQGETEANKCMSDLNTKAKLEIDALIEQEINAYRNRWQNDSCCLIGRIRELEERVEKLSDDIEQAKGIAEEALGLADEALHSNGS